jgi:hypothetical protein
MYDGYRHVHGHDAFGQKVVGESRPCSHISRPVSAAGATPVLSPRRFFSRLGTCVAPPAVGGILPEPVGMVKPSSGMQCKTPTLEERNCACRTRSIVEAERNGPKVTPDQEVPMVRQERWEDAQDGRLVPILGTARWICLEVISKLGNEWEGPAARGHGLASRSPTRIGSGFDRICLVRSANRA